MTSTKPTNSNVIIFVYDIYIDVEWKRIGVEAVMNIIQITIVNKYTIINKLCFLLFQKMDIHYMQTYSKYTGDIYPPLFSSGVT